ncbi:tape measure protein [Rhizobium oryziradicis]|uniref:Phage tail protein n=1 Tax=Rhizobium oryziradicis TaxID=1867956 RepID=A0A1Q8ZQ86_9HYPH|nr:tape measure protein [Rhizobium oryziradicis]OLP44158.1 phage tail protein [Rhizobium oryziradicis]
MATDVEKLVVQLSADIKSYQREMQKAAGITNRQARAIEDRYKQMDKRLAGFGSSAARGLIAPLTGVAAAISTKEVLAYADAWTSAKNSLAVAGVVGDNQVQVLDKLYQSAQSNSTPIGAMADLFGKAAQASDNLGASQADLLKFSDGVGVALRVAGTGAAEASGALTQLGQLLGSSRVQAEEFNSVNEGARPILIAVANGLDAAGGSVNKLKQLVNDGKVSGQQFFQAFLKGLPTIQAMAANSTQTIEQGVTKVNNAFTRYIGQSDESLGASQRLVAGLNALADNFDNTADIVLKLASVIAGALVGRSIAGMIANLGLATTAVVRLVAALRAASSMAGIATALGGVGAAAGPLGLIIGGTVVGALALFSSSSNEASQSAKTYADALAKVRKNAEATATSVENAANRISERTRNALSGGVQEGRANVEAAKASVIDLFSQIIDNAPRRLISEEQLKSLADLRDGLTDGKVTAAGASDALYALANSNPKFQKLADQLAPLLDKLKEAMAATSLLQKQLGDVSIVDPTVKAGYDQYSKSRLQGREMVKLGKAYADEAQRQNSLSKEQLAIEKEIAKIKTDLAKTGGALPDAQIKSLATANVKADEARSSSGKKTSAPKTADSRFETDIQAVRDRTAALIVEQQVTGKTYVEQEKRRMALDLEQQALADVREEARKKGDKDWQNAEISKTQRDRIEEVSAAYAEQADMLRKVEEAEQRAQSAASEFYDTARSAFSDVITGAESFSDALSGILKKLGDLALNSAFDSMFGGSSATASGGWLTGLFKSAGFADGGYTGAGGKYEPAGIVHKGEYVMDAETVRKAGGPAGLDAMRKRLKGYSAGGYVGPSAPRMPDISRVAASRSSPVQISFNPVIDNRGASVEAVARNEQALQQFQKTLPAQVVNAIRDARARGVKI